MISDDLRQRRLKIIKEHMETEVTQEFDLTLATFNGHPHYEIVPTGQVFDGADEVMGYYRTSRAAFPDLRHGNVRCHVADDTIIVEFDLVGTNLGEFSGMPPTGTRSVCQPSRCSSSTATASSTSACTSIPPAC
jgi:predicted ester cyclase